MEYWHGVKGVKKWTVATSCCLFTVCCKNTGKMKTSVGLPVVPFCLLLLVLAVNCTPSDNASKAKVWVFTDVDILCRLPENAIVEEISSLQIAKSKKNLEDFDIFATAVAKESFPNREFNFPGANVSGSLDEGHLLIQIPNITRNALGIYKCTANSYSKPTNHQLTERLVTLAKKSTGTLYSHPPGFQIKIRRKASVTCNQGCMCNQTFLVNTAVYILADQPRWHCLTDEQGDQKCWMSAVCEDPEKTQFELKCAGFTKFSVTETGECTLSVRQPEENVCPADHSTKDMTYGMAVANTLLLWLVLPAFLVGKCLYDRQKSADKTKREENNRVNTSPGEDGEYCDVDMQNGQPLHELNIITRV